MLALYTYHQKRHIGGFHPVRLNTTAHKNLNLSIYSQVKKQTRVIKRLIDKDLMQEQPPLSVHYKLIQMKTPYINYPTISNNCTMIARKMSYQSSPKTLRKRIGSVCQRSKSRPQYVPYLMSTQSFIKVDVSSRIPISIR
jgi:hypothetical protein